MILNKTQIEEIRRLNEARTPGKWGACDDGKCPCKQVWTDDYPIAEVTVGEWGDGDRSNGTFFPYGEVSDKTATANAAFIAACSEAIPNLLDTIDAMQLALKAWRAWLLADFDVEEPLLEKAVELMDAVLDGKEEKDG